MNKCTPDVVKEIKESEHHNTRGARDQVFSISHLHTFIPSDIARRFKTSILTY
jgi:hypothetical protein